MRVPCHTPSSRSVVAASSGVNGSACRLVKMLSRPNIVMNHGRPAAGRLCPPAVSGENRSAARSTRLRRYVALERRPSRTRARGACASQRSRSRLHVTRLRASARRAPVAAPASSVRSTTSSIGRPARRAARSATLKVRPFSSNLAGAVAEIVVSRVNVSRSYPSTERATLDPRGVPALLLERVLDLEQVGEVARPRRCAPSGRPARRRGSGS